MSFKGLGKRDVVVRLLLLSGVVASILYVATDVLAAVRAPGYSYAAQSVSQLLAVGTPMRPFVVPPMTAYNLLMLAFGIGVWLAAGWRRSLKVAGVLLVAYAVASQLGLTVFPLHLGQTEVSVGADKHIAITAVLVVLMLAYMAAGAIAGGRAFRIYTLLTFVTVFVFASATGMQAQALAENGSSTGLGLMERANIYATMLWVAVFGVALLRSQAARLRAAEEAGERPKKKVVALLGSPHKGGAAYTATRKFLDALEAYGDVQGEIVTLSDHDIRTCRGCKVCFDRGAESCPLRDDRDVVVGKMMEADGIVFASPNYSYQISGVMKVFLDRLGFMFHRPRFHGKASTAIVVQGIYGGRKIRKYLEFVGGGLGCNVVKGTCLRTLLPMTDKAWRDMDRAIAAQSSRFHERLLAPSFPAPSLLGLALFRMSRTSIRLTRPEEIRDYTYFRDHGWFESDYWYPTNIGLTKKVVGVLFDWVAAQMSTSLVAKE
jgi:multimeric flavodoxin WrbA